jgi:hypothetical protein
MSISRFGYIPTILRIQDKAMSAAPLYPSAVVQAHRFAPGNLCEDLVAVRVIRGGRYQLKMTH